MSDETEIQIITPPIADLADALDHALVVLTEAICQATGDESGYGLGGRFGYGENFENEVFVMRRYFWGDCDCGADERSEKWHADNCSLVLPNFKHKASGFEVRWYKWIGRDMKASSDATPDELQSVFAECMASLRKPA